MKIRPKCLQALLLPALALGIEGCAHTAANPYPYVQQKDSASLSKSVSATDGVSVFIEKIDGYDLNISLRNAPQAFVSPGSHEIGLYAWALDDAYSFLDWQGSITASFVANHNYRFSATMAGSAFGIGLWDETLGASSAIQAAYGSFIPQNRSTSAEALVDVDFAGFGFSRPPLASRGSPVGPRGNPSSPEGPPPHNGGTPQRPGGPPSIPHAPRPSPGGGGHGGGGGHSGGGGGGHKK